MEHVAFSKTFQSLLAAFLLYTQIVKNCTEIVRSIVPKQYWPNRHGPRFTEMVLYRSRPPQCSEVVRYRSGPNPAGTGWVSIRTGTPGHVPPTRFYLKLQCIQLT